MFFECWPPILYCLIVHTNFFYYKCILVFCLFYFVLFFPWTLFPVFIFKFFMSLTWDLNLSLLKSSRRILKWNSSWCHLNPILQEALNYCQAMNSHKDQMITMTRKKKKGKKLSHVIICYQYKINHLSEKALLPTAIVCLRQYKFLVKKLLFYILF